MGDWQKIDTAPKDGSKILVFGDHIEIGSYYQADEDKLGTWCDSGQEPTHWLPLPAAPAE